MIEFLRTLIKRFRCDHDYRLLSIEWDGVSYYKCDKCEFHLVVTASGIDEAQVDERRVHL